MDTFRTEMIDTFQTVMIDTFQTVMIVLGADALRD